MKLRYSYLEKFGPDVADGNASKVGEEGEHPALALVVVGEQAELLATPRAEVQHLQPLEGGQCITEARHHRPVKVAGEAATNLGWQQREWKVEHLWTLKIQ